MSRMFDEQLYRVSTETIESLALMFLVDEDEAAIIDPDEATIAQVDFAGPFGGSVLLRVTEDLLPELAANMLGRPGEQDVSVEHQHDALKELANVICGNILPEVGGVEAVFNVSSPAILDESDWPDDVDDGSVGQTQFFIDGGMIEITLRVDDPAALTAGRV